MSLHSLVLCSDEKIVRVLRRVLSDLEIGVELCSDPEAAIHKLTRQRFEAVIVDCADERVASQVLRGARSAPCNKRAIAVAIIDGQKAVRGAFELGAHFVLYKPISAERAKSSFRAARALMKRERRRNTRVPLHIQVVLITANGHERTVTADLSEGGMALQLARRPKNAGPLRVQFTLPGTEHMVECAGKVAWENNGRQSGLRFEDMPPEMRQHLKAWLDSQSGDIEKDDPPVQCKLTDLSLGGCYLQISSPFPVRSHVILSMRVAQLQVQVEGLVRVMHPEVGMGVEFTQHTPEQRQQVEKFIQSLTNGNGALPTIFVQPEGMDDGEPESPKPASEEDVEDPLLDLFRSKAELTADAFQVELSKQRGGHGSAATAQ